MTTATATGRIGDRIRHTHWGGFRCGEWATIIGLGVSPANPLTGATSRPVYVVQFLDDILDMWAVNDPLEPYEFDRAATTRDEEVRKVHRLAYNLAMAFDAYLIAGRNLSAWKKLEEAHQAWADEIHRQLAPT